MKTNRKTYTAYFMELLVVVLGITIAFTLDNYASNSKLDREEKLYKEALISDLEKDIASLDSARESSKKVIALTGELFNFMYTDAPVERYTRAHVTSTYTTPYFYSNNGTYQSLINSGDLKVLSSFELRQELVTLYNVHYVEVSRADEFIKDLVTVQVYPYILSEIAFHPIEDRIIDSSPLKTNQAVNLLGSFYNLMSARNIEYGELIEDCKRVKKIIEDTL